MRYRHEDILDFFRHPHRTSMRKQVHCTIFAQGCFFISHCMLNLQSLPTTLLSLVITASSSGMALWVLTAAMCKHEEEAGPLQCNGNI